MDELLKPRVLATSRSFTDCGVDYLEPPIQIMLNECSVTSLKRFIGRGTPHYIYSDNATMIFVGATHQLQEVY